MKVELGKISVRKEEDVIILRRKLLEMGELLSNDPIFSVKMASISSTFFKKLVLYGSFSVNAFIEFKDNIQNDLIINCMMADGLDLDNILKSIKLNFGRINYSKGGDTFSISFRHRYNSEMIDKASEIFSLKSRDELLDDVQIKNKELEKSLRNLKTAKDLNARMESELEVGKNIQMSMLPSDFISNENVELFAKLIPAREVGGDFYDFLIIDKKHLYFTVGDVSGKGVPAALMMAVCKTLLKSKATNDLSTANILTLVNNEIARDNKNYMFITVFLGILNLDTKELTYTNAGHNPTYIKRKDNKVEKLTNLHGPVIGAEEDLIYKEDCIILNEGDLIFAYTDGIPEAHNSKKNMFTDKRLYDFISNIEDKGCEDIVNLICEEVIEFEGGAERFDDITALAINTRKTHLIINN